MNRKKILHILHLSDIHFKRKENQTFRDDVQSKMMDAIKKHLEEYQMEPDFTAVTGDIAFSGKEYNESKAFFKELKSILPKKNKFLVVPGNHDVNRDKVRKRFSLHRIVKEKQVDQFLEDQEDVRTFIHPKFKAFREFTDTLKPKLYREPDDYFWVKDFKDKNVSFLGLNSCWACEGDNDRNNITLGFPQVMKALKKSKIPNKIVLMHHPMNWLNETDFNRYSGEIYHNCQLLLHGHTHTDKALVFKTPADTCICLGANASYTNDKEDGFIGFQFIMVEFRQEGVWVEFRPYRLDKRGRNRFVPDYHRWEGQDGPLFELNTFKDKDDAKKKKNKEFHSKMDIDWLARKKLAELEAQKEFDKKEQSIAAKTAEDIYRAALKEELGTIFLPGSPDIECRPVSLEDAFVSLCISESQRVEERFDPDKKKIPHEMEQERHFTPEQVTIRAFKKYRLLLVIGDPGSGKTTLLKYYAIKCLKNKYKQFGFKETVFPIYFPLRELEFDENEKPRSLPYNLAKWSERHLLNISAEQFRNWLHTQKTLVLLDGLDEISSKEKRQKVPLWVKETYTGLKNACFVVTSRATGYRKLDGIELEMSHLRADIMDFSSRLQEDFLKKWFRAVYLAELPPQEIQEDQWEIQQIKQADQRSKTIIDFLNKIENKAVRELAAVPMLLQIMAIIWKKREFLPRTRVELYDVALNYLLDYRDRQKCIEPFLPVVESRRVLAPTALWMQEKLARDEAPREDMHQTMQERLNTLEGQPQASAFCAFLRDRAGVIADYDKDHYIFRHKSFREFLSGIQLKEDAHKQKQKRIKTLVQHFNDDWWEETLRFFMNNADDEIFDRFMQGLFKSKVSQELDAHRQTLLQNLVREAPQKKINALKGHLNSDSLNSRQRRYVMDCLKIIGTPEAIKAIENADKTKLDESNLSYAEDIVAEATGTTESSIQTPLTKEQLLQDSFRNIFEGNVEYIKVPGGTYIYSVSKQMVTVPDLFFCKYPVTNKRYRLFISYQEGKLKNLVKKLPLDIFAERLLEFSKTIKGYTEYLGKNINQWQSKLRSRYDDDKKFNGDDQPVVGITWYDTRAYCFWLSCLDAVIREDTRVLKGDLRRWASVYRLPTEEEWEWTAGGEADGSTREYPWPKEKGKPNKNLANYGVHVGATTPVDRYPEGATPHGLMDMAGNVFEWMENLYRKDELWRALRGGSWINDVSSLRCSARGSYYPDSWGYYRGFRVVRS